MPVSVTDGVIPWCTWHRSRDPIHSLAYSSKWVNKHWNRLVWSNHVDIYHTIGLVSDLYASISLWRFVMPQSHWGRRYYGLSRSLPGHPGSWTGMNRVKMTFFCRKISTIDRRGPQDPGAPRGTQVHPGRAPAGPRFVPALTRFKPVLGPVHPGPCRQNPGDATVLPGSPRRSYGPSRFTTVHPGEVNMQYLNRTDL